MAETEDTSERRRDGPAIRRAAPEKNRIVDGEGGDEPGDEAWRRVWKKTTMRIFTRQEKKRDLRRACRAFPRTGDMVASLFLPISNLLELKKEAF